MNAPHGRARLPRNINRHAALVTSSHTGKTPAGGPVVYRSVRQLRGRGRVSPVGPCGHSPPGFRAVLAGATDEQTGSRRHMPGSSGKLVEQARQPGLGRRPPLIALRPFVPRIGRPDRSSPVSASLRHPVRRPTQLHRAWSARPDSASWRLRPLATGPRPARRGALGRGAQHEAWLGHGPGTAASPRARSVRNCVMWRMD